MIKIPIWKLVLLLVYSCSVISILMFVLSLAVQWLGGDNDFLGPSQLHVALKMGGGGLFWALFCGWHIIFHIEEILDRVNITPS